MDPNNVMQVFREASWEEALALGGGTLRQLREDGLVGIDGQIIVINDLEALATLADFEKIYLSRFRIVELLA